MQDASDLLTYLAEYHAYRCRSKALTDLVRGLLCTLRGEAQGTTPT